MSKILIVNGELPNFEKNCLEKATVLIDDGKISAISKDQSEVEKIKNSFSDIMIIDASEKIVSSGFIDIHMHEEDFIGEGDKYIISEYMLKMGVTTCAGGNCGVQFQPINSFKGIIEKLGGSPVNYLMLVGYNSIRKSAGHAGTEPIRKEEQSELIEEIKKELKAGAIGVSFGIEYDKGIEKDEIINVINQLKDKELLFAAHYRDSNIEAVKEMIEIANITDAKFQISHLSSCSASGDMNEALGLINDAIEKNPKIDYDTYPYIAFSTYIGSDVFFDGCIEKWGRKYSDILITDGEYKGKYCDKELFWKIRKETPKMLVVAFVMNEDEITEAVKNKNGMVASDAIIAGGKGHPRAAGTFPKVFKEYVREKKVLSIIDAIKKVSYFPAMRLGLVKKAEIKVGNDADIVIFDPKEISDGANFETLDIENKGIDFVIVNGKISLHNNNIISNNNGKFISSL